MFKLEESISGPLSRRNDSVFHRQVELARLNDDIASLKQRITHQVTLVHELTWEAQDASLAKMTLNEMQETIRDWHAHRDLLVKLLRGEIQHA